MTLDDSSHGSPRAEVRSLGGAHLGRVENRGRQQDRSGENPVTPGVKPSEMEGTAPASHE